MAKSTQGDLDTRDMVFRDMATAMDFLYDLGCKLPDMFEFSPPKNGLEYIRASEGGQSIVLYKDGTMTTQGDTMPVFICSSFCDVIGKYSVYDIMR